MSDPVTNVQIEDVLSSIRRLVSADDRPEAEEKETEQKAPEALVLTPSLRVTGDAKPAEAQDQADDPQMDHDAAQDAETDAQDHHEDAQLEDVAEHDDGTPSHDAWTSEDEADVDHADAAQDIWQPEGPSDDHETHDVQADDHSDGYDDEEQADAADSQSQGDKDQSASVEHHHAAEAEDHSTEDHQAAYDVGDDHAAEDHAVDEADDTTYHAADHGPDDQDPDELSARVAGFEDAVAARDDGWEPDGDDDNANAAQPMDALPWQDEPVAAQDHIEDAEIVSPTEGLDPFEPEDEDFSPEMVEDTIAEAATNAFLGQEDPLGEDAAILDEEALRDLVTDIVREELQGALGERITRNVRKLVRREIHRALATQELE